MRFLVLAPMPVELAPVVRALRLQKADDGSRRGRHADHEVVAALAGVGTDRSASAAARWVASASPDHVLVVGIAGGVRPTIAVGDLLVPAEVRDLDRGTVHQAAPLGPHAPAGVLATSGELILDRSVHEANAAAGIDAIDMETSAIAAVAEGAGLPWTAFRGISDHVLDGLLDDALDLLKPDGSADVAKAVRHLARHPSKAATMAKLASGTRAATRAATTAAVAAIAWAT